MNRTIGAAAALSLLLASSYAVPAEEAAQTSAAVPGELTWPRTYDYPDGGKLVLYQPQATAWPEHTRLKCLVALAFSSSEKETPSLGAFELEADSEVDLESRLVRLSSFEIIKGRFPSLEEPVADGLMSRLKDVLPPEEIVISLDRVLANLARATTVGKPVDVKPDPPRILVSTKPAVLVMFDGEPIWHAIGQTGLQFAVNTNWDLFLDPETSTHYLLHGDAWLAAPALGGPWGPAGKLPKAFNKLPKDDNWKQVREHLKGRKLKPHEVPAVHVSQTPAELIVTKGKPKLGPVPETQLLWVTNTESDIFLHGGDSHFYFLVSGRWYRTPSLEEPDWSFATDALPEDFAKIPEHHPTASVLASVPGTSQALEAVLLAHIPNKADVERDKVTAEVHYVGEPEFESVEGTSMSYAVNTQSDVVRVGDGYYLCFQGVWFVSTAPTGPWQVAETVPDQIYTIPPSSPVHHTTYVRVYGYTPGYVTYGYTSGYYGTYYSWGTMVYGTGWYYSPYYYAGPYYPYPIYYGYPHTYGVAAYYNPYTGTYGRGASVYGPYGGMGRSATYNPRTGTYSRGAAAFGPYQARGWSEAYNPRTGTYARSRQGASVYSSWGTTGVRHGNDWARTARYSGSGGTVAGVRTSRGTAGVLAWAEGGGLYAGRDGNVYRRSGASWERYENGSWAGMDRAGAGRPSTPVRGASPGAVSGRRSAASRRIDPSTLGQLDRDLRSRADGARSHERFRSWSSGGGQLRRGGVRRR